MRRRLPQVRNLVLRHLALSGLALLIVSNGALAQSGADQRAQDQSNKAAPANAEPAKDNQRKIDQFVEAAQAINGPAGNPECVWLGRRVVQLMYADDVDTALRHIDLYDRFGCPGGHIQAAFRCMTRFMGEIDSKVADSVNSRVHACWINPNAQPQAAASTPAPSNASSPPGTPPPATPAPAK